MRRVLVVLLACAVSLVAGTQIANAAPADVSVRIEGLNQTIFDRVVHTDGRQIQSSSDSTVRTCDGTNLDANPEPGPTPTAASVDAMEIIGETFDGNWYDGYDDYFITRWGPDAESNDNGWWWGILVNGEFTPVGGCQFRVVDGDEILWINDAFSGRPMLHLEGPATALVGTPVSVKVSSDLSESYQGATVGGINAAAVPYPNEIVEPGTSGEDGNASVTFDEPGWKRLKARDPGTSGLDDAVASNSIDICVERKSGDGCTGEPPSQIPAQVGQDPAVEIPEPEPTCETDPSLCPIPTCETDPSLCPLPSCETDPTLCPAPTCETDPTLCPVGPEKKARLALSNVKVKPSAMRPGRKATVVVKIRNAGDAPARKVKVCVGGDRRLKAGTCHSVGKVRPAGSKKIKLTVKARPKAKPGKGRIKVKVTSADTKKKTRSISVRVKRPARR